MVHLILWGNTILSRGGCLNNWSDKQLFLSTWGKPFHPIYLFFSLFNHWLLSFSLLLEQLIICSGVQFGYQMKQFYGPHAHKHVLNNWWNGADIDFSILNNGWELALIAHQLHTPISSTIYQLQQCNKSKTMIDCFFPLSLLEVLSFLLIWISGSCSKVNSKHCKIYNVSNEPITKIRIKKDYHERNYP